MTNRNDRKLTVLFLILLVLWLIIFGRSIDTFSRQNWESFSDFWSAMPLPAKAVAVGICSIIFFRLATVIIRNWEFFVVLNYYCNLLAQSKLLPFPTWVSKGLVFPLKLMFFTVGLVVLPIRMLLNQEDEHEDSETE